MHYKKIKEGNTIIEFHNNWLGQETIIINGQIVSKKSSVWGTDHYFTIIENGHAARYVLTTKVNPSMQVFLDLRKDGKLVQENIPVFMGGKPRSPKNNFKKVGMAKLNAYEIEEAVEELNKALDIDATDPEIYFYLACAYSIQEKPRRGFECIKKAVEHNLQNTEMILNHDMLAFLRMEDGFEEFLSSNFSKYDESKLSEEDDDD